MHIISPIFCEIGTDMKLDKFTFGLALEPQNGPASGFLAQEKNPFSISHDWETGLL